jgi:hypothetical protein
MNSRQRIDKALHYQETDRVPADFGGTPVSAIHVSTVYKLRQALHLDPPGTPIKVIDPFQMLGEIKPDLTEALESDVVPLWPLGTFFGFKNIGWKPWTLFDGTPVLVPEGFNTVPESNGDILMYPQGDRSASPSGRMPRGGFYFDVIVRQPPVDDDHLNVNDNLEEFVLISDEDLDYFAREAQRLHSQTDKAIAALLGGTSFADIGAIHGAFLKNPRGIRSLEELLVSMVTRQDYLHKIFAYQCDICLKNLDLLYQAVGNRISIIQISLTDVAAQNGPLLSEQSYRQLLLPYQKKLNDWVHRHTHWKVSNHCCGAVLPLMEAFIDAGFDILNPVQTSAVNMNPKTLKEQFGARQVFWGGGVDTQKTLPFGTPDEVHRQVKERLEIFGRGGGFVFNVVHNIQANVPVENILAMIEAYRKYSTYPLGRSAS